MAGSVLFTPVAGEDPCSTVSTSFYWELYYSVQNGFIGSLIKTDCWLLRLSYLQTCGPISSLLYWKSNNHESTQFNSVECFRHKKHFLDCYFQFMFFIWDILGSQSMVRFPVRSLLVQGVFYVARLLVVSWSYRLWLWATNWRKSGCPTWGFLHFYWWEVNTQIITLLFTM